MEEDCEVYRLISCKCTNYKASMLDILGLGEEVERGGDGKGPGSIVSTSLTIDGYCCGLAVA